MKTPAEFQKAKYTHEKRFILAQSLMLLSVIFLLVSVFISPYFYIVTALMLGSGFLIRTHSKDVLQKIEVDFLHNVFKPRLEKKIGGTFSPEQGLPRTFFEGMKVLPLEEIYISKQRIEGVRHGVDYKIAYVKIEPFKKKFRTFESQTATFSGKVFHAVFPKAATEPILFHNKTSSKANNAIERGEYFIETKDPLLGKTMFEDKTFDALTTFLDFYRSKAEAHFYDNHLVILVRDYKPFITTELGHPLSETHTERVIENIERFVALLDTLQKDTTVYK